MRTRSGGYTDRRGDSMSYVNPAIRSRLDAMPDPVQQAVLSMDVMLVTTTSLLT